MVERVVKQPMLKPLGNRVIVKQLDEEATTAGGIVLPDSAKKKPQEAEIVALGEGERLDSGEVVPIPLKKGDVVVYPEYSGTEIRIDDEDYLIIDVDSLLALKEPTKKRAKKK